MCPGIAFLMLLEITTYHLLICELRVNDHCNEHCVTCVTVIQTDVEILV
jgi:hypothetical protein